MMTKIRYGRSEDAWSGYEQFLLRLIRDYQVRTVCDVGGGANPELSLGSIADTDVQYSVLDISATELAKAPSQYHKIVTDISAPDFIREERFDLIFSKMLAEHIYDAKQFHKNIFAILKAGGLAIHFFPTLYTLPFLANLLLPERLASELLNFVARRDSFRQAKFPAYYRWCRGPTERQLGRFSALGYEVLEYHGFFGHVGYYERLPVLRQLHERKTAYLLRSPKPHLTSYAYVVLRKPESGATMVNK